MKSKNIITVIGYSDSLTRALFSIVDVGSHVKRLITGFHPFKEHQVSWVNKVSSSDLIVLNIEGEYSSYKKFVEDIKSINPTAQIIGLYDSDERMVVSRVINKLQLNAYITKHKAPAHLNFTISKLMKGGNFFQNLFQPSRSQEAIVRIS